MKFGMLLSLSLVVAASALASDVPSQNVVGILRVDSSAKRTVVAVPWAGCSQDGSSIKAADLVKTSNLTVGDKLHVLKANDTYDSWVLAENAAGVKYWNQVIEVDSNGTGTSPDSKGVGLARGSAIILIRENPTEIVEGQTKAVPFYLFGQYVATSASSTVQAGTSSAPCYNLIAPSGTSDVPFSSIQMTDTPAAADRILVPQPNGYYAELKYDDGWKCRQLVKGDNGISSYQWVAYSGAIPAGTGVWYVSYGGAPTFTW